MNAIEFTQQRSLVNVNMNVNSEGDTIMAMWQYPLCKNSSQDVLNVGFVRRSTVVYLLLITTMII